MKSLSGSCCGINLLLMPTVALIFLSASSTKTQSFALKALPRTLNSSTHKNLLGLHRASFSSSSNSKSFGQHNTRIHQKTALYNNKSNFNPFSLVTDSISSMMPLSTSSGNLSPDGESRIVSTVSSCAWDDISNKLQSKSTPAENSFRDGLSLGYGPASPLHNTRLYDESNKEEDVRVVFYRDSASWCPYCQKVWITLETKRIPYRVERINMRCYGDKPATFLRLQPNGNIPVCIIDGTVYGQSNDILSVLETTFGQNDGDHVSLSPNSNDERRKSQELFRLERSLFSAWMYWLTGSSSNSKTEFMSVLQTVEDELSKTAHKGGFFLGDRITMVDVMFAPFLERMAASLLFFKGFQIRVAKGENTMYPNVNKWFDAMELTEGYTVTKSDYYTHCWDLPPQLGGCTYEPNGEPYENAINGIRSILDDSRGSWELPLEPNNGGLEPDWNDFIHNMDEHAAKREAVERLSFNHEGIVKFASRGAGKKGMPPVMAALADPNATPNEAVLSSVDAVLRIVCLALLDGTQEESTVALMKELASSIRMEGGEVHQENVVKSIAYLRDRVGVPRDMRLPAARQLRAHLNWALSFILEE